jgi:hypothetical protein
MPLGVSRVALAWTCWRVIKQLFYARTGALGMMDGLFGCCKTIMHKEGESSCGIDI